MQKDDQLKEVITGYKDWVFPGFNSYDFLLILFIILGFFMVFGFEKFGSYLKTKSSNH